MALIKYHKFFLLFVTVLPLGWGVYSLSHLPLRKKQDESSYLRLNMSRQPLTLDPRKTCDYISSTMEFFLYDGLMRITESGIIEPGIAYAYEISDDCCDYTFHLRPAVWSDGTPITAFDFERSWKEILSPGFPSQSPNLLYSIKGAREAKMGSITPDQISVKAVDENTLKVSLEHPTPYFLELTSFCVLFPTAAKMENRIDEIAMSSPSSLVTSGPFILKEFKPASHYVLVKNPLYWDHDSIFIEQVEISLVPDDSTAYQLFKTGKLDILGLSFSQIPKDALPTLKKTGELTIVPISATSVLQFNTVKSPFSNQNFRKALAFAIDRQSLCDHITQLNEMVADGLVKDSAGQHEKRFNLPYNPELAREYLNLALEELQISKKDLPPIKYLYTPSDQTTRIVLAIKQQVADNLGINLILDGLDFKVFLSHLRKKDFDLCHSAWILQYNDPMNMLERFKTKHEPTNDTGWEHPDYALLIDRAEKTSDLLIRRELMNAAEAIFMEELPQVPIFFLNYAFLKQPNIENISISPIGVPIITRIKKLPKHRAEAA